MIIELENGTRLEVPDGAQPEHIDEIINDFSSRQKQAAPTNNEPSLKDQAIRQLGLTGRYAAEGLTALPFILGNATNQTYNNIAAGSNKFLGTKLPGLSTDLGNDFSNQITQAGVPEPQSPTERVVGEASKMLSTAGSVIGPATRLSKLAPLAVNPVQNMLSSGLGAGASETAKQNDVGPMGQALAGIGGALAPAALSSSLPAVYSGIKNLNTKELIPNAERLAKYAHSAYDVADESGGMLHAGATNKFIDNIQSLKPQTAEGSLVSGTSPFTDLVDRISALKDKPISLRGAQEIDEHLSDVIDGLYDAGRLTKQGKKVIDIQSAFRDMIDSAGPQDLVAGDKSGFDAWKQGQQLWSSSRKLSDIERIITRAEMTDNPATSIKTGFRTLYNNPSRMRGFSTDEKQLIKKAAESGITTDLLRTFGSRLTPIITTATGGGLGADALSAGASMAARNLATKSQVSRASKVADMIARNAAKKANIPLQSQPKYNWLPYNER